MAPLPGQTAQHTAFQRETICVHEDGVTFAANLKCFEYGNCIYREKDLRDDGGVLQRPLEKVAALRRKSDGGRLERWLTGEEVCGQLRISPRTLQTLRDKRLIGYSQINRRFYYKPEEVRRLIPLIGTLYPGGR